MPKKRENIRFKGWVKPQYKHGKLNAYNWLVLYPLKLKLGRYTDIGAFSLLVAKHGIEIGDYCQLGAGVKVYSVNTIDGTKGKVVIKEGACIGANSVILPGVTIGKNSIVGALSLVTKDIPDNVIACGIPCKVIKQRSIVNKKVNDFPLPPSEKIKGWEDNNVSIVE